MTSECEASSRILKVAVLAGGESAERSVSLESGAAVAKALAGRGHRVTLIDPAETDLVSMVWQSYDAAFLALHGAFGEDGHVQSLLESLGVPYTGSDAATSRLAFSKSASKERFTQRNVPTPPYVLIHQGDDAAQIHRHAQMLGYPLVVKPDAQGSSLGVSIVSTPDELPKALARCFHFDAFGILESYIAGSEWTVGLVGDEVLPLIQIETTRPFFDFQAKYEDDATQYHFEFALPTPTVKAIEAAGRNAAAALGTQGIARIDLRLDRYHQPWVLEINTIPGFTSHSLVPKAAARKGVGFGELCEWSVRACLAAAGRPDILQKPSVPRGLDSWAPAA